MSHGSRPGDRSLVRGENAPGWIGVAPQAAFGDHRRAGEGRADLSRFVIHGGRPLEGEIVASGSKNAALPMIAAALLTDCLLYTSDAADE